MSNTRGHSRRSKSYTYRKVNECINSSVELCKLDLLASSSVSAQTKIRKFDDTTISEGNTVLNPTSVEEPCSSRSPDSNVRMLPREELDLVLVRMSISIQKHFMILINVWRVSQRAFTFRKVKVLIMNLQIYF